MGYTLSTVTTNSSGFYTATIPLSGYDENIFIKVKSSGLNITVKNSSGTLYTYDTPISYGITEGQTVTKSYTASNSTSIGKSISVHQSMELANRYMYSLEGSYMGNINVSFPNNAYGITFYNDNGTIYVIDGDEFDWDVLEHEYGHYVASQYNILASVLPIDHYIDLNQADVYGKSIGIKLAWNEGWATYFAINLQNKMSASSMNIPNVGDSIYDDTVDTLPYEIHVNIENVVSDYLLGEANEIAVAGILYDITDGTNISDFDYIHRPNSDIWTLTKNNACKSLSDFITAFYSSGISNYTAVYLGHDLSHFKVAAHLNDSPAGLANNTPTFTWAKQGGSTDFTNNHFYLVFYDSSLNSSKDIDVGNTTSKTFTSEEWSDIKGSASYIYCCVLTYQTDSPSTGPYYSNPIRITFP